MSNPNEQNQNSDEFDASDLLESAEREERRKNSPTDEEEDDETMRCAVATDVRYHGAESMGPFGMMDGPIELAHNAFSYQEKFQNMSSLASSNKYENILLPDVENKETLEFELLPEWDNKLLDGQSQMMEESYDSTVPGLLEPEEFNKSTAVISSRGAEDVCQAIQTSLAIQQSKGREISYEQEGFAFDVQFTHENKTCDVEILLLETGDDHPTPGNHAILYNKLNGNGFSFQRFYRESVAMLANDLTDLKSLNGTHLPTMEVMADNFDYSDAPSAGKHTDRTLKELTGALEKLRSDRDLNEGVEVLRETTASLRDLAAKFPSETTKAVPQNIKLIIEFRHLIQTTKGDTEVVRNVARFFNALIKEDNFDFDNKPTICRMIVATNLLQYIAEAGSFWVQQKGEKISTAKLVTSDIGTFIHNLTRDFFCQGEMCPPGAQTPLKEIVSNAGSEFESFAKTCSWVLAKVSN